MFEGIKNAIRRVVSTLFASNSIEQKLDVKIAVSSSMDNAIQLWKDMYENNPPWASEGNAICTNIPATIAEEMSRLILTEYNLLIDGSERADYISEQVLRELKNIDQYLESLCAKGGIVFKPYVCQRQDGTYQIEIDVVEADRFYPTEYNSKGEIASAVFTQSKRQGEYLYTRLEYHEFKGNSVTITNKAYCSERIVTYKDDDDETTSVRTPFNTEVSLETVPEWSSLSQEPVTIENLKEPLFVYIKTPKKNGVDSSSPLGVSVYSKAIELLREADKQFGRIVWEYEATEAAIHVGEEYLQSDKHGNPILPEGKERLYRAFDSTGGINSGALFDVYGPQIRDTSLYNGWNRLLKRIEWNVGLAYGTISDPDAVEKTATEILSSKQRSYRTIRRMQQQIEDGIIHLIDSIEVLCDLYEIVPSGEVNISCQWGDGVLEDTEKEYQRRWAMVVAGKLDPVKFMAWYFKCDEETAAELMPQKSEDELGMFGTMPFTKNEKPEEPEEEIEEPIDEDEGTEKTEV